MLDNRVSLASRLVSHVPRTDDVGSSRHLYQYFFLPFPAAAMTMWARREALAPEERLRFLTTRGQAQAPILSGVRDGVTWIPKVNSLATKLQLLTAKLGFVVR